MDILVPSLATIFGIETSGLIFTFLIFVVTVCGALLVNKALYGRVSIGALFVFCILYNGIFAWGFMNYLFGLGMAMLAFGMYLLFQQHSPVPPNHCFIAAEHGCFHLPSVCICDIRYFVNLIRNF